MVTIFCLLSVLAAAIVFQPGPLVQFALESAGCEFTAEESSILFFPARFEAKTVRFRQGLEAVTAIHAEIDKIEIPFSLIPLLAGKIRLGEVVLQKPRVEVIEGDEKSPEGESERPDLMVEGVKIIDGQFRYRRIYPSKEAVISVHDINGQVGKLNARSAEPSAGRVKARLEQSGAVDLSVNAAYFADSPNVSVVLEIADQALPDLNPYFVPADGVELFGTLVKGRGTVSLTGDRIEAAAMAKYTNFDILMRATRERSKGEAFLTNLLRPLKIDDENVGEPGHDQNHGLRLKRKKTESVVGALLRGLREAVLQIATT